jgi:peroxiredoxin
MSLPAIPSSIILSIIQPKLDFSAFEIMEGVDLGKLLLESNAKLVLFAVPGAYTPTCTDVHVPGFIRLANEIQSQGVECVYCISVNDRFVMKAWANSLPGALSSRIKFIADGNGEFTLALSLSADETSYGMGIRSKRYAAIIENGQIQHLFIDEDDLNVSSAENIIQALSL